MSNQLVDGVMVLHRGISHRSNPIDLQGGELPTSTVITVPTIHPQPTVVSEQRQRLAVTKTVQRNPLVTCTECGQEIATSARLCPHCGAIRKHPLPLHAIGCAGEQP